MIEIKIKPCCIKCRTPDLDIDTNSRCCNDNLECDQTIKCKHQHVCKTYLKSGMSFASIKNGFDVK